MNTILPSFTDIEQTNEYLSPFPNLDNIFVAHQSWLKDHFLPLISIDLGMLKPEWQGQIVHIINPFEPEDGVIGNATHEFHNEFTGENWLAFKLTDDNRYEFLGNEGYFLRSPIHDYQVDKYFQNYITQAIEYHQKQHEFFKQHGFIAHLENPKYEEKWNKHNLLDDLGGGFGYGNWVGCCEIPSAFVQNVQENAPENTPNDGIAISYQGKPFYYIGSVAGYYYCNWGANSIIVMYEPISKIVLFTFDWT